VLLLVSHRSPTDSDAPIHTLEKYRPRRVCLPGNAKVATCCLHANVAAVAQSLTCFLLFVVAAAAAAAAAVLRLLRLLLLLLLLSAVGDQGCC